MEILKQTEEDIRFFLRHRLRMWRREWRRYPALRYDIRHRLRLVRAGMRLKTVRRP